MGTFENPCGKRGIGVVASLSAVFLSFYRNSCRLPQLLVSTFLAPSLLYSYAYRFKFFCRLSQLLVSTLLSLLFGCSYCVKIFCFTLSSFVFCQECYLKNVTHRSMDTISINPVVATFQVM